MSDSSGSRLGCDLPDGKLGAKGEHTRLKKPRALQIHARDNVAVAVSDVHQGQIVEVTGPTGEVSAITAESDIPFGFKIALADIAPGDTILKYGESIGEASQPIKRGYLVHVDNIRGKRA